MATTRQVDILSEEVVDLGQKMTMLTLDMEEERSLRVSAEKEHKLQDFGIKQHDLGFDRAVRQAAVFYQVPVDEGKFDNRKDIYKGELTPVMDIPDEDEAEVHSGIQKAGGDLAAPDVIISNLELDFNCVYYRLFRPILLVCIRPLRFVVMVAHRSTFCK